MNESSEKVILFVDENDPEMQQANERARAMFKYFWRERAWERRRIVPALDMAVVKAPFTDGEQLQFEPGTPAVEQMWLDDVEFDGKYVEGVLLNSPNWLKTVKAGDSARFPFGAISDWMYAIGGVVYGAYTVNLMRSRMGRKERSEHDAAWGLDFGDPNSIRVVCAAKPEKKKPQGLVATLIGSKKDVKEDTISPDQEHPMSVAMASSLASSLAKNPDMIGEKDARGWTLLHQESLAGSAATVKVLLAHGADPAALTDQGMTPIDLAQSLDWENVVALLRGQAS